MRNLVKAMNYPKTKTQFIFITVDDRKNPVEPLNGAKRQRQLVFNTADGWKNLVNHHVRPKSQGQFIFITVTDGKRSVYAIKSPQNTTKLQTQKRYLYNNAEECGAQSVYITKSPQNTSKPQRSKRYLYNNRGYYIESVYAIKRAPIILATIHSSDNLKLITNIMIGHIVLGSVYTIKKPRKTPHLEFSHGHIYLLYGDIMLDLYTLLRRRQ